MHSGLKEYDMAIKPTYKELEKRVQELEKNESEHKSTMEALLKSEVPYLLLFEHANVGIFVAQDGCLKVPNPYLSQILDYSRSELEEQPLGLFIHPEHLSLVTSRHQERLCGKTGLPQTYDFRVISKNGKSIWVQLNTVLIQFKGRPATLNFLHDITDHKSMEEALREREEKYRLIFNMGVNAMFLVDNNTTQILECNNKASQLFGYSSQELLSMKMTDLSTTPEATRRACQENVSKTERVYQTKDGGFISVEITSGHFYLANKAVHISAIQDITEKKLAEEALQKSEERLKLALDSVSDAVWDWRIDTGEVYFSSRWYTMLGYKPYELPQVFETWRKLLHPDDLPGSEKEVFEHLEMAEPFEIEFRMLTKNNQWRWILARGKTVEQDDQGNAVRMLGTHMDITERKKAEKALQERLSYEQLLSRVSVLAIETDDLYVFQNKCLAVMGETMDVSRIYIFEHHHETDTMDNTFEWVAEGVLPQKDELQGVSSADSPWWMKVLKSNQIIKFSDINDIPDDRAKTILHHQQILSILVVPLFTAGQYYGFLGFDDCIRHREWSESDATFLQAVGRIMTGAVEKKRAEYERDKLQNQLSQVQKAESLGRMAGAIAHHFNNQLSVVLGNLELVLDDLPDDAENRENLFQSFEAGRKAAEVSQQMLRYLGHESGSQTTINLSDVCRQSLTFLQSALRSGVTLNIDLPDSGPFVHADDGQIQQILTNLFTNAQESLPDNQGIIDLMIQTISHEDISISNRFPLDWQPQDMPYACLEISDTGCGISKEDIIKIFDPFYTTKFTGRGMGLPVTMGFLKTHGGCIAVKSEVGRGSAFRVYLPVTTEIKAVKYEKRTIPKRDIGNGSTVLLIEDEASVRNTAKAMLTRLGYAFIEAQDGVEAVRLFEEHQDKIDYVLSDLTMPRMDGWETLTELRRMGAEVPVILASGYDKESVMSGDHPELPQGFLNKPYSMAALKEVLMEVIRL